MTKSFHIIKYEDPGHGWGKVKRKVLQSLGVEGDISPYSFQWADNVYLEEDNDLPKVVEAIKRHGTRVVFTVKHTDRQSRVRSYEGFKPENAVGVNK